MRILTLAASVSLALGSMVSASVMAQETEETNEGNWIGIYGLYYNVDDKPEGTEFLDDGFGGGIEAGFRFSPRWAGRIEYSALDIRSSNNAFDDQSGQLYGVDALYFLKNDAAYLFGGFKILNLEEDYSLFNVGVGKHWEINDRFKFITEVAALRDFGEGSVDYGVKMGVAYTFGSKSKAAAAPAAALAPQDSDNDGVIDANDRCPGTPAGTKVDNNGCALVLDQDKDGVVDSADLCPNTPIGDVVDNEGCTVFGEETISETVRVLFGNNSAKIMDKDATAIVDFANFLKRYGKTSAVIEGHASAPGTADYNLKLSEERAQAFKDLLVDQYGIDASRLSTEGYGETQLLDKSNTAEANRINRRIVVNVSETIKVKLVK